MPRDRFGTLLSGPGPVLIDGGLSTQLEGMGLVLGDSLWTARTLLSDPAAVIAAHRTFVDAGAQIVITASYQVSRAGFAAAGLSPAEADQALLASIDAARAAVRGSDVLVAASIGPYGAVTHDGGEYRGRYGLPFGDLVAFHEQRLQVLEQGEPDLLAIETIPDADEARAVAAALGDGLPAWVCFTAGDDAHVRAGQRIEDAVAAVVDHPAVRAVGVNCTEPRFVPGLLARIRAVTDLPLIAYPNAGGSWDPVAGTWTGPAQPVADAVREWRAAGATVVGGCCGTDARLIAAMRAALAA